MNAIIGGSQERAVYIGDNSETFLELAEPARALKMDGMRDPSFAERFVTAFSLLPNCEVRQLQGECHEHRPEA